MIFLVSGEGPGDIGSCSGKCDTLGICPREDFQAGPLTHVIDVILDRTLDWGVSPREAGCIEFVPKPTVIKRTKELSGLTLPGTKQAQGTALYFKNARAFARLALEKQEAEKDDVAAVLFRDSDGTNSSASGNWQDKVNSMKRGFEAENFKRGVPMIARPRSEAWFICALKQNPYECCDTLETSIPGNDDAPRNAKTILTELLTQKGKTTDDLGEMVSENAINVFNISMPSFDAFRKRLEEVSLSMSRG